MNKGHSGTSSATVIHITVIRIKEYGSKARNLGTVSHYNVLFREKVCKITLFGGIIKYNNIRFRR
jgi:hypothetical protein